MEQKPLKDVSSEPQIVKATISLSGMTCASCVRTIEQALEKTSGVSVPSISVNLLTSNAILEFDKSKTSIEKIKMAICNSGYDVEDTNIKEEMPESNRPSSKNNTINITPTNAEVKSTVTKLSIYGMSCASCVNTIQQTVESLPGVIKANVNLLTSEASVRYNSSKIGARDIIKAIEEIGFEAHLLKKNSFNREGESNIRKRARAEQRKLLRRFILSSFFAVPTFIVAMIFMLALPETNRVRMAFEYQLVPGLEVATLILFILSTPVQFLLGYPFYVKGIRS
ncbi:16419_t:CDS:1, partial [Acaulospora morrowiae]